MNCTPSLHSWYSLHIWAFNISVEFAGSVLDARSAVHGQWFSRLPAATSYDCPTQVTLPFVTGVLSKRRTIGSSRSVVQQTAGCDELWLSNASYFTIRHWRPVKADSAVNFMPVRCLPYSSGIISGFVLCLWEYFTTPWSYEWHDSTCLANL